MWKSTIKKQIKTLATIIIIMNGIVNSESLQVVKNKTVVIGTNNTFINSINPIQININTNSQIIYKSNHRTKSSKVRLRIETSTNETL